MVDPAPQDGGCLCGAIRYRVSQPPLRVSFCHCRYCQKVTGAAYAVEPIFNEDGFELLSGTPKVFSRVSDGSSKVIHSHFCPDCGSGIRYTFERFPEVTGIHAGGFDDPNWFDWTSETAKHIFLSSARPETVIPAGLPTFAHHAMTKDGDPIEPLVLGAPEPVHEIQANRLKPEKRNTA